MELPGLVPVSFEYDERGRLVNITEGEGLAARASRLEYNAEGYIARSIDPLGRVTSFEYDAAGRVITEVLPDGRRTPYTYDAHDNVTSITPPGRPAHRFTYTPVDLEETYNPPPVVGGGTNQTRYDYNLNRQVIQITRPDGQAIGFAYDTMGRLVTLTVPGREYAYVYNANTGNLTDIIAPNGGAITYGYDGSLVTSLTWAGTIAGSVGYGYDNNFRLTSLKVNNANPVAYQYDRDGLLTNAGALTLSYNMQNGMLTGTTLGNITDTYTYNTFGEATDYVVKYNNVDIYRVHHELDALGRITSKTETVAGETHIYGYTYDIAGRLIDVTKDGVQISHYDYDDNGNRLGYTGVEGTVSGTYDDQDRLLTYGGITYEYTANGELLRKTDANGTTHYTYDVLGNLTTVVLPDGTRIDYIIDGQNRRIGKKVNGVLVQGFLYQDDLNPVAELEGAGNVISRFVYATRINVPDYIIKSGVIYRVICDHLGSPKLVVNTATGQIVQRMDYDEFGNVVLDTNPGFQPFGFAGGLCDKDTRLVRFRTRDYDAETGRWFIKDPLRFAAGDTNIYNYTFNNPINLVDPDGLTTVGIGFSGQAAWGKGVTGSILVVFDGKGNIGLAIAGGGGGGSPSACVSVTGQWTNGKDIYSLEGFSTELGGSIGEGQSLGGEWYLAKTLKGVNLNYGFLQANIPIPAEGHAFFTYTKVVKLFNYKDAIKKLFGKKVKSKEKSIGDGCQ
ncbi:MAG: RHS repeat protein [Firmicutes bacterium]|nr:RHS repeat protein [Bacillota bacterium]